jgi:plastocyanin
MAEIGNLGIDAQEDIGMKSERLPIMLMLAIITFVASLDVSHAGSGASSNSTPSRPSPSSTASIAGHVKFEGAPPPPMRLSMVADPSCAKMHPGSAVSEDFVIGNDHTLGNVVVYVSDGLGNRTFEPPSQPAVIEQKGCMYEPHVVAVRANQTVRVINQDSVSHNIHPIPANNREWNKAEPGGTALEETFAREEVAIPIKCNVHPWMRSYVAVFKHPFFAVTGKDGNFDLRDLPPGEYTVQAWHEKLGTMTQKITVAAGEAKTVDFVFKAGIHR